VTARDTYAASVASAQSTSINAPATAATPGFNANAAAFNNSVAAGVDPKIAQRTLVAANLQTEMMRQVAISAAKDVLKSTGDTFPT